VENSTKVLIVQVVIGIASIVIMYIIGPDKIGLLVGWIGVALVVALGFLLVKFGCDEIADHITKTIKEVFEEKLK